MFELSFTISDLLSRESAPYDQNQILIIRFGPVKFQLQMLSDSEETASFGSKKVLLEIDAEGMQEMFRTYALGLFLNNVNGNFFAMLSLAKLNLKDQIVNHQVHFYNQTDQVAYVAEISLGFQQFKEPRLPKNTDKIQQHKTFNEYFQKPSVPKSQNQLPAPKTLTDFVKKNAGANKYTPPTTSANVKSAFAKKPKLNNGKKAGKNWVGATQQVASKRTQKQEEQQRIQFLKTQFIQRQQQQLQQSDEEDDNPPIIDFVNTQNRPTQDRTLSKTLFELNNTAPQHIKLTGIFKESSAYSATQKGNKNGKATNSVKNNAFSKTQTQQFPEGISTKQNNGFYKISQNFKYNRQQLKERAKKELESYQGSEFIQIPIFKNGKCELVNLNDLSEQQILSYVQIQRDKEEQEKRKNMLNEKLSKQQKETEALKAKLFEREMQLARQKEQASKLRNEAMLVKRKDSNYESSKPHSKKNSKIQEQVEEQFSQNQLGEQSQDYSSDFQSASLANSQLKSRLSSKKKAVDESQSYNESYDPDFQSYSQSLLGNSQKKMSFSQISDSSLSISRKKY